MESLALTLWRAPPPQLKRPPLGGDRRTIIRTLASVLVAAVIAGCAPQAHDPTTGLYAPRSVSEITLSRLPGGWGAGASYTITLRRDQPATFEGRQQAPRTGTFTALLPPALFDSLALTLVGRPFFRAPQASTTYQRFVALPGRRSDECVDYEKTQVTLRLDDTVRSLADECRDSTFESAYAAPIEAVAARLNWTPRQ